jgi:hypothetical protein
MLALGGCVSLQSAGSLRAPAGDDDAVTGVAIATQATGTQMPAGTPLTSDPRPVLASTPTPTPARTLSPTPSPTPTEAPTATPEPTPTPRPTPRLRPRPRKGPLRLDLYRRGDFVSQFESWYCLPAALQTMINILEPGRPDRSRRTQDRLYRLARRFSTDKLEGKGAEPIGWARALEHLGYGEWEVKSYRTRGQAVKAAVKAIRMSGKPVGMLTWRGAHSWVMSGFRATADPALTDRYQVTSVAIQDVWYPRVSSIWGRSDPPGSWVPVEDLGRDFLRYNRWSVKYPGLDGRYVLVMPVPKAPAA